VPHAATLSSALSHSIAAFLVDGGGRVVAATKAADAICRRGSTRTRDALLKEQLPRALVDGVALDESIARALSSQGTIETPPLAASAVDGRYVRLRIVPRDKYVIVFVDDVHELVADERRRARRKENDVFEAMAEVVAHRVANPLAGFSAALQLTSASLAEHDPRRETLARAQDEVKRLASVCTDLLSFADAGTAARAPIDLRSVVDAAVVRVPAPHHATVVVAGDGAALGDAELLARGLRHLLVNAWEAGALRVVIHIGSGTLRVEDDGPGLVGEASERAFVPFFTTKVSGTGLGLAIVERAVAGMGGTIRADRSALGGALFEICLLTRG
jgi:signal transduction histidine kinase